MHAYAETEAIDTDDLRQYRELALLYDSRVQDTEDWQSHRSVSDKILGLVTMALISACGWAVIIELGRLLW